MLSARWRRRAGSYFGTRILVALLLALPALLLTGPPGTAQEPSTGCYTLHEVLGPAAGSGPDQTFPWVLCPAESWRNLGGRSPLNPVLQDLADEGPTESRWWAGELAGLSSYTLNRGLCRAVAYVRSVSPPVPGQRERVRSGAEIKAWVLDTLTGPSRPPEIRALRPIVAAWSPKTFRAWHDALKSAWPDVAATTCPEAETPPTP